MDLRNRKKTKRTAINNAELIKAGRPEMPEAPVPQLPFTESKIDLVTACDMMSSVVMTLVGNCWALS
jgi:hypothetical protein